MKHRQAIKMIMSKRWDSYTEGQRDVVRSTLMKRTNRDIKKVWGPYEKN